MGDEGRRVIESWLADAREDVAAARVLGAAQNRHAAFHLQQAAEKIVKAVRIARGHYATAGHHIEALLEDLSEEDEWRHRLAELEPLAAYATTYRYPTAAGRLKPGPDARAVEEWLEKLETLLADARLELLGK